MGLLTEDIIDQNFITVGSLYEVYLPSISYENNVFNMNYWGPQLINDIESLPTILDSKNRIRIDGDELINLLINNFVREKFQQRILNKRPYINIASSHEKVYYSIMLSTPYIPPKDPNFSFAFNPPITRIGTVTLTKKSLNF